MAQTRNISKDFKKGIVDVQPLIYSLSDGGLTDLQTGSYFPQLC